MIFAKQVEAVFSRKLLNRQDNRHGIFYFSAEDFPGLKSHGYSFRAVAGHTLNGFFYHYDNPIPGRLVVFDHGMGNGHRAYMTEIQRLAKAGYLVFSYDHTGCMTSSGGHIGGFAQSLSDLDACLTALKREEALKGRAISVMGHSWGGFSTMNIAALHPEVTHVVSMSGFISVEQILRQELKGFLRHYVGNLLAMERRTNPGHADIHAVESLKNTTARVLLIYSADDKTVRRELHYDPLYRALSDRPNIRFLLVDGKDHNPTYTADAVTYKNAFWKELSAAVKGGKLSTAAQQQAFMSAYDWHRMTAQDESVWDVILAHLGDTGHETAH